MIAEAELSLLLQRKVFALAVDFGFCISASGKLIFIIFVIMKRKLIPIAHNEWKSISFYREDDGSWYARVPGHTKAEKKMVAGSDKFLQACLDYINRYEPDIYKDNSLNIEVCYDKPKDYMFKLTRLIHDPWGATYKITPAKDVEFNIPVKLCWLCNVTHTVLGEHPKTLYIVTF